MVFGLGLVGLLAVQILRANGCQVLGFDFVADRVELTKSYGAVAHDLSTGTDPVAAAIKFSDGVGVDAVLVTASTSSNDLMHQAADMCRQRGRIVLTGVVGLDLQRSDFYEKELEFSVSCSYGPGRYDPSYEDAGNDYPIGYVRWTEQRNFAAVLALLADKRISTEELTTKRVAFSDAASAYAALTSGNDIGILLDYDTNAAPADILAERLVAITPAPATATHTSATIGVIGAGAFANGVLLPGLVAANARIKHIASSGGVSGSAAARRFSIENSTTDNSAIFNDPDVDAVVITTRHNSHARLVCEALDADKEVFVEKPLALNRAEINNVLEAFDRATERRSQSPNLMVGFNRRFAPVTGQIATLLKSRQGPAAATFLGNAGAVPASHWVHDPDVGGGRIIGEACHYIDYLLHLVGSPIVSVMATGAAVATQDTASIQLSFADGSVGTVQYFALGAKSLVKERCEIYFDGNVLQMDNFKSMKSFGITKSQRRSPALKQQKGPPRTVRSLGQRHSFRSW